MKMAHSTRIKIQDISVMRYTFSIQQRRCWLM